MQARIQCCCFAGHGPNELPFDYDEAQRDCVRLKVKLAVEIEKMRKRGVTTFLTSMTQGMDIWGAEIVINLKRAYSEESIQLVAVIPYEEQVDCLPEKDRDRYFAILSTADETVILQTHYTPRCMLERDQYMVDHSAHMIALFNGTLGGIKYIVRYACKKGLNLAAINPDDLSVTTSLPTLVK